MELKQLCLWGWTLVLRCWKTYLLRVLPCQRARYVAAIEACTIITRYLPLLHTIENQNGLHHV